MTNIARVQFGSSAWMPVLDGGPLRAVMPIIVTVRGFDTTELVLDLAEYISKSLTWAKLGETVLAFDSVPIETGDAVGLAARIGALAISIAPSQPAPIYSDGSGVPDQAVVRILLEQLISPKEADRDDPLIDRRRDIVSLLGALAGPIP